MSRSAELWEQICAELEREQLLSPNEIEGIAPRVLEGNVSMDDWKVALENTLLGREQDAD